VGDGENEVDFLQPNWARQIIVAKKSSFLILTVFLKMTSVIEKIMHAQYK